MSLSPLQQPSLLPTRPVGQPSVGPASSSPASVASHTLLQLGSRGSEVTDLQSRLNAAGFKVPSSGVFDAQTQQAVRAYQQAKGLKVDGLVGQQTWGSFMGQHLPPGVWMLKNDSPGVGHSRVDSFRPTRSGTQSTTGAAFTGDASQAMARLAQAGRAEALRMGGYTSQGLCATGVARAINDAFGIHVTGDGNTLGQNLPANRFQEVHMSLAEALKIPGLVLSWQHTPTPLGFRYGHVAITTGDGQSSCSDFVENNTLASSAGRTGLHIYRPIGQ